jgi:hypothetical protein
MLLRTARVAALVARPIAAWSDRVPFLDDDAWKSTEHDFDLANLIATAFRSVGIGQANGDSLDGRGEFSKLHPELATDTFPVIVCQLRADDAHMRWRRDRMGPVARQLHRTWQ